MLSEKKERAENVYTRLTPWYHIASCYKVLLCGVLQNEKLSKAYSPDDACKSSRACDYLVFSSRSQVVNQSLLLSVLVFLPHAQHIYPAHISQKSCFHRRRMCRFAFSPLLPVFILCLNAFQKPPATRLAKMVTKAFLLKLHGDCLST